MSRLSPHHETLNEYGEGKCSVPMWSGGCPAGFCDEPAFGIRPPGREYLAPDGSLFRYDGLYAGYISGLACPSHGGPPRATTLAGGEAQGGQGEAGQGKP